VQRSATVARPRDVLGAAKRGGARRPGAARALGSFVPGLTRKVFQKYGFSTATLVTDWAAIVGPELAAYTQPERLKWPVAGMRHDGTSEAPQRRRGASLLVRVGEARALDVQYKAGLILERINSHFGYRAIEALRIVQAPIAPRELLTPARRSPAHAARPMLAEIAALSDEGLRSAFHQLQAAVFAGASRS